MTTPWIRCTDRMPPDDEGHAIVRKIGGHQLSLYHYTTMIHWLRNKNSYEWIPYDKATWRELQSGNN